MLVFANLVLPIRCRGDGGLALVGAGTGVAEAGDSTSSGMHPARTTVGNLKNGGEKCLMDLAKAEASGEGEVVALVSVAALLLSPMWGEVEGGYRDSVTS